MNNTATELQHRQKLIDFWRIAPGMRVLEIGCGQGETTQMLVRTVGKTGCVHGIDPANADYGAPETLGEARARIVAEFAGYDVRMMFGANFLADDFAPLREAYDCVVLSHCAWYFASPEQLAATFSKAKTLAPKLCFAEWDLRITDARQLCHRTACCIQALCACHCPDAAINIATLFHRHDILRTLHETGWHIADEAVIVSPELQHAVWERDNTLCMYAQTVASGTLPHALKTFLDAEILELQHTDAAHMQSLPVFALAATA